MVKFASASSGREVAGRVICAPRLPGRTSTTRRAERKMTAGGSRFAYIKPARIRPREISMTNHVDRRRQDFDAGRCDWRLCRSRDGGHLSILGDNKMARASRSARNGTAAGAGAACRGPETLYREQAHSDNEPVEQCKGDEHCKGERGANWQVLMAPMLPRASSSMASSFVSRHRRWPSWRGSA